MKLEVFAPGKLVLAGEYAVLSVGGKGLVLAVSAGVRAFWSDGAGLELLLGDETLSLVERPEGFSLPEGVNAQTAHYLRFVLSALNEGLAWLRSHAGNVRPFRLTLVSEGVELAGESGVQKLGMGSSAASVVATLAGFWHWHFSVAAPELDVRAPDPAWSAEAGQAEAWLAELCTRAIRAHRKAQGGKGSGIDVAASVYGGLVAVAQTSKGLEARRVLSGESLVWRAVWTGRSVETTPRVASVEAWAIQDPEQFQAFMRESNRWTDALETAISAHKPGASRSEPERQTLLEGVRGLRSVLRALGQHTGVEMETPGLQVLAMLAESVGAAKQSGAGGGDCGVVVLGFRDGREEGEAPGPEDSPLDAFGQALDAAGLTLLPLSLSSQGVSAIWTP